MYVLVLNQKNCLKETPQFKKLSKLLYQKFHLDNQKNT